MLTITSYSVELVKDPFGILTGQRYEFLLDIEVPEDDELHSEKGLYIRAIYSVEESKSGIVKYDVHEQQTEQYLDFDLEDEELRQLNDFCQSHLSEAD
jgi:hypothetical protein